MTFLLLLLPPFLAALLASLIRSYRPWVGWLNALLSLASLGAAVAFAAQITTSSGRAVPTWGLSLDSLGLEDVLRVDSLSALLLVCVSAVASLSLFLSPGLGRETQYTTRQLRRYHTFINLFIAAMLLALSANNVGLLWIAVEATTIFSAFIIPLKLNKTAVEASWKYILIGSVGIALAFAGTVLAYFDFVSLSGRAENALNWTVLLGTAPSLHPEVMRLAFVFLLVGYGTKAGIAPMHTWKPDAYGESPAPLTALMSSALFAVAMYAIVRWKVVADATLNDDYTDNLLIALGLLSLVVAAFSVVLATNYKRMLAYSSIEHTGLICLGLALGPLGAFAALLHLVNHTAAKSLMFFLVANIERKYSSPFIADTGGLLKTLPWTGALFAAGLMALIGLPPGGIFISEFALFRAGFALDHPWLMGTTLVLLTVVFVSFIHHLNRMLYGAPREDITVGEIGGWRIALLFISVAVLVTLGLTLPAPLATLLNQIVEVVAK
jgi:hydrogenase-4 component F